MTNRSPSVTPHRHLTVFRHAPTKKGDGRGQGSHLSADGVALARRIGADLGPFYHVYASPHLRTTETALAMGFAVDDTLDFACGYVAGEFEHHAQWAWEQPYVRFAEILCANTLLGRNARADAELWTRLLLATPPGSRVLIVSHGGSIEPTLVACLPDADHHAWGKPFSHCDGVTLTLATPPDAPAGFLSATFHRAPESDFSASN